RGDQEGQQRRGREGLQGPARPHHRHAHRQADDPREGPSGQPRPALRQDGDGSEVPVPDHEAGGIHRSDEVHGLGSFRRRPPGLLRPTLRSASMPDPAFIFAQSLSGLTAAMFLFLIASGLSLIFGVLRVLNFAHGSFYMLGAYGAYQFVHWVGTGSGRFWWAVVASAVGVTLLGGIVERLLFRHLYAKDELY